MFQPVDGAVSFPALEEQVLAFWKEGRVYEKSLAQREGAPAFVFYEGPPTANGMPHPGHCLTRTIKDVFPRYRTMRGFRCERKAGWDTHGLPVEVEVCKELGIHSKEEIEAYGIEPFIQKCQASVWRYMQEWRRLTERLGFWVNLDEAYVTYHQSYIESVWWSLKTLFDRGLLYQGHKIVWWWAQGGTALSAGEVGQGYREVADPSVYVKFPLLDDDGGMLDWSLIVWTTTPWTLPSNQFAAVNPALDYALVVDELHSLEKYYIAADLVETIASKLNRELKVESTFKGAELVGRRYRPPFDCFFDASSPTEWKVVSADFVTTDSGSGIVHQAPAFGEVDYEVLVAEQSQSADGKTPKLINCVAPDGKFTDEAPDFVRGRWVKDCDKDIIRDLKQRGLLFHQEQYLHDYPFCWRAEEDPLIQYPRESWFIKTTAYKDAMIANNQAVNWLPEHIKDGRMGKFLESNVDWALSRERYWGTPLPIWQCEATGKQEAIGGYDELLAKPGVAGTDVWDKAKAKNPDLPDDLRVHKPYIDAVIYDSPFASGARMKRVTEVIDCWYDSGAMPFAQWGYRGETAAPSPSSRRGEGLGEGAAPEQPSTKASALSATNPLPNPPPAGEGVRRNTAAQFFSQFPADFISEALDQTRGWFYSQLAISTMLFGEQSAVSDQLSASKSTLAPSPQPPAPAAQPPHPFRNCIVLGLMLGEDGQKMSKQKRNYREPREIFDKYGADALRWYLLANQPPWTAIRYSEQAIKDSIPEFLLRLWNCYSFLVIYANIDGWTPNVETNSGEAALDPPPPVGGGARGGGGAEKPLTKASALRATTPSPNPSPRGGRGARAWAERSELDRWIVSELHRTAAAVIERMDAYDNFAACGAITEFVDALSNWWVRRSRDRFWAKETGSQEKLDAYATLYECLTTTCKIIAPFTPFLADAMWRNLSSVVDGAPESVHLCDFPEPNTAAIDQKLSERMALVRLIASLGRRAREGAELKVRQPLARVEVILADNTHQAWLEAHAGVIADELNVKAVEFSDTPEKYVDHEVLPNFKLLGKRLGKLMPKVKQALGQQSGSELLANLRDNGLIDLEIDGQAVQLTPEEVEVRIQAKPGWASANDKGVVAVLSTELTPELVAEGLARDIVRAIQDTRKERGCEFTDRIEIGFDAESEQLRQAVQTHEAYIVGETLADSIVLGKLAKVEAAEAKIGDGAVRLYVRVKS